MKQNKTHHSRYLTRNELLLHLLGEGILESEVVPPVDQELVLQMLGWVEIFASWLLTVTSPLKLYYFVFSDLC